MLIRLINNQKFRINPIKLLIVILATLAMVLCLLTIVSVKMARPKTVVDPIGHTIQGSFELIEVGNDELIRDWLVTLVFSQREDDAIAFAQQAHSLSNRVQAYIIIADALIKVGKLDEAQDVRQKALLAAMQISSLDSQLAALAKLSAIKDDIDDAFHKALKITDHIIRSDTFSDICIILLRKGNFDGAIKAAHNDVLTWKYPELLLCITKSLLDTHQPERAKATAQEALEFAKNLPGGNDILESFAPVIAKAGLANELFEVFLRMQKKNHYIRDEAFEAIAVGLAESGDTEKALAIARSICINCAASDGSPRALASVSQSLREAGKKNEAELILTEALDTALKIKFPVHRSWALHKIAPMLVRVGRTEDALNAIREIGKGENELLAFVAVALIEVGKWADAERVLTKIFNDNNVESQIIRSRVLLSLVRAMLKAGRADKALNLVELSQQKLAESEEQRFKYNTYKIVGPVLTSARKLGQIIAPERFDEQGMERSATYRVMAEALAMVKEWNQAITTGELCKQKTDKLAAYTAFIREYSIAKNPSLENIFNKAIE